MSTLVRPISSLLLACLLISWGRAEVSEAQRAWAAGRTVRVGSDPDFDPFSKQDPTGRIRGVDADLLASLAGRTGLVFENVPFASWPEAWQALEEGRVDVLTGTADTPARHATALFTEPYAAPRLAIITRVEAEGSASISALTGQTVAIPRLYAPLEDVMRRVPGVTLATGNSLAETLALVADRRADAALCNLASAVTLLPRHEFRALRVAGFYDKDFPLCLAVRKDLPELVPVLNAALGEVSAARGGAAYAEWVDARLDEWAGQRDSLRRQRLLANGLGAALPALGLLCAWLGWRLSRVRRKLREALAGQAARLPLDRTALLERAFEGVRAALFILQRNDRILHRNPMGRELAGEALVLPVELVSAAEKLRTLPRGAWLPVALNVGGFVSRWQARLTPMGGEESLLTLFPGAQAPEVEGGH